MPELEKQDHLASDLISLSQAAQLTPYSREYLTILATKGKLPAVKIGRDWLTTRQAVLDYLEKQKSRHRKRLALFESAAGGHNA